MITGWIRELCGALYRGSAAEACICPAGHADGYHYDGDACWPDDGTPCGPLLACKCGWRPGILTDERAAAERLWDHIDREHGENIGCEGDGWSHCSPAFILGGGDCAGTLRRPCPVGGGHDHHQAEAT